MFHAFDYRHRGLLSSPSVPSALVEALSGEAAESSVVASAGASSSAGPGAGSGAAAGEGTADGAAAHRKQQFSH